MVWRWSKVALMLSGLALGLPAVAAGGGWATVSVDSPPPPSLAAGAPWNAELEILQHGVSPLEGVKPTVLVWSGGRRSAGTTFRATPTSRPGVYSARVVFPKAGTWRYEVDDGFSARHPFAAVRVGEPAAAAVAVARESITSGEPAAARTNVASGGGWLPWILPALGAAVLLAVLVLVRRRGLAAAHG